MKIHKKTLFSILCLTIGLPSIAGAASIAVTNASFEDNDQPQNWANGIPGGWTSEGGTAGTTPGLTVDGPNRTFMELSSAIGASGGDGPTNLGLRSNALIYQDLGVPFLANTVYTGDLLANRRGGANNEAVFGLSTSGTGALLGTAGGFTTSTFTTSNTFLPVSSLTAAQGNVATFTTGATAPAGNVFLVLSAPTGNAVVDLISVDATTIPEPSSLALISLAALGILRRRR